MVNEKVKSILAADCGRATTTVVLIELVGEVYRLIAQAEVSSTYHAPWFDITLGVADAIKRIEQQSGGRLLDHAGSPIIPRSSAGEGADIFVAVASAAEPLSVSLVGLMSRLSLASARHAVMSTYAVVNYQLGSDDEPGNRSVEARVKALQQMHSDLILLVGGIDGGATGPIIDLAHIVSMALRITKPDIRPQVIYAGNSQLRAQIADILGSLTNFKSADNIRPDPAHENLGMVQEDLSRLYIERKISQLPGIKILSEWSRNTIVPSAKSFAQTVNYIGQTYNVLAMGVDVGSATTNIAAKRRDFYGNTTRADIGVGSNAPALLDQVDWENFRRWLPFEMSQADFKNFVWNKGIFPQTVPQTYQDMWLELSLMREALRLVLIEAKQTWSQAEMRESDWFNWDLIIGVGRSLVRMVDPTRATLVLLDGLEPAGICRLVLDTKSIVGMLGSLAGVHAEAAAQIVDEALQFAEDSPFLNLGMVVAPIGVGRFGDTALRLQMTYSDGRQVDMKVPFGAIEVIPLPPNEEATLKINPSRYFSLNPQWEQPGKEVNATVNGGLLGLIIDARGRPITLADNDDDRAQQLQNWLAKLGLEEDEGMVKLEQLEVEPDGVSSGNQTSL
jgi:ribosomal protein L30/L7E